MNNQTPVKTSITKLKLRIDKIICKRARVARKTCPPRALKEKRAGNLTGQAQLMSPTIRLYYIKHTLYEQTTTK